MLWIGSVEYLLLFGLVVGLMVCYCVVDCGVMVWWLESGEWYFDVLNVGFFGE